MSPVSRLWLLAPCAVIWFGLFVLKNAWATVFAFHAVILAALWIERRRWDPTVLWRGEALVFWLPILGASAGGFGWGLVDLSRSFPGYGAHLRSALGGVGVDGWGAIVLAIYVCVLNPILEEAFWRGLMLEHGNRPAMGDFAYGGMHLFVFLPFMSFQHALCAAVFLTGMGYAWRRIALRHGGLAVPVAWHALGDAALIVALRHILAGA